MTHYQALKYRLYYKIWILWHSRLRRVFDRHQDHTYHGLSRPWWHLCCNGNAGGWRTDFCRYFDDYVHYNEPPWRDPRDTEES